MTLRLQGLRSFFGTAAVVVLSDYLILLTDCILAGRVVGEVALSAICLLMPIFSLVTFLTRLCTSGAFIAYSKAVERGNRRAARGLAGQVLLTTGMLALGLVLALSIFKAPYLAFMNPDGALIDLVNRFWPWYLPMLVLNALFGATLCIVKANRREVACIVAYGATIAINIVTAYYLSEKIGIAGLPIGSAIALLMGVVTLLPNFFGQAVIPVRLHFRPKVWLRGMGAVFGDNFVLLFHALIFLALTKYILIFWDSESLAVCAVVVMIVRMTAFFGGVGVSLSQAREKPHFMEVASMVAFAFMALCVVVFFVAPELVVGLFGIDDPELADGAKIAARITVGGVAISAVVVFLPLIKKAKKLSLPMAPLNYLQSYVLSRMGEEDDLHLFNLAKLFKLRKGVDLERLSAALVASARTHSALKTALFRDVDGEVLQRQVFGDEAIACPIVKMNEAELLAQRGTLIKTFNVFKDMMLDAKIFDCGENAYLLSNFHHIICDGYSFPLILEGARKIYNGEELQVDAYYETLVKREERSQSAVATATRQYMRETFKNPHLTSLPTADFNGEPGYGSMEVELTLPSAFEVFLTEHRLTRHHVFLAATVLALARLTGKDDILIDWVFHGRISKDELKTVGAFMVDLPLLIEKVSELTTSDVLSQVKQATFKGIKNVASIREVTDVNPNGRDRLTFNYQDEWGELMTPGPVKAEGPYGWMLAETIPLEAPVAASENPFNVEIMEHRESTRLFLEYDSGQFSEATVRRYADLYKASLKEILV